MVRPLRIEYEDAVYHVTSRGNAQSAIYLDVLRYVVEIFSWECHAYCLMSNHYHLMIETPQPNLSRGMSQLKVPFGTEPLMGRMEIKRMFYNYKIG